MMTLWPSERDICSPISRATVSVPPPAAKGTTSVMVFTAGCASAGREGADIRRAMPARAGVQSRLITGAASRAGSRCVTRVPVLDKPDQVQAGGEGNGIEPSPHGPPNPTGHMRNLEADSHTPERNESHNLDSPRLRGHHQPVPRDAASADGRPELKPEMAT